MILNLLARYSQTRTTYEADPRHVQIWLNELHLNDGRAVSTHRTPRTETGDKKSLTGERVRQYRSLVMRCPGPGSPGHCLCIQGTGQTDVQCDRMDPYEDQEKGHELIMYADSDDAGCHETRKSTSCGALVRGAHLKCYLSKQHRLAFVWSVGVLCWYQGWLSFTGSSFYGSDLALTMTATLAFDASAAKAMLARKGHGEAKHTHPCYLWLQQKVQHRESGLKKTGTKVNQADAGTKYLEWPRIQELMCSMSLVYSETERNLALHA